jgi:nucleotide-binding universal stress UspA family protein
VVPLLRSRDVFKHILIPTDGSPIANKAVKAGIRFAREIGAEVTAYQAIGTLLTHIDDEGYVIDPKIHDEFERSAREAAERRLEAIGKLAKTAGVPFTASVTMVDAPHKGIINAARKHKCDVIFMASHGRRGVASLLLGSVTQKVLTHCKIPVLVYR